MPITGFETYKLYLALKSHFQSDSYDISKYNGKMARIDPNSFDKRNDKFQFIQLGRKYSKPEIQDLFVANIIDNRVPEWIGICLEAEAELIYTKWKSRTDALPYTFDQECKTIYEYLVQSNLKFKQLFAVRKTKYPRLFNLYFQKKICIETLMLFDSMFGLIDKLSKHYQHDHLFTELRIKFSKYRTFLPPIDINTYAEIFESVFGKDFQK